MQSVYSVDSQLRFTLFSIIKDFVVSVLSISVYLLFSTMYGELKLFIYMLCSVPVRRQRGARFRGIVAR